MPVWWCPRGAAEKHGRGRVPRPARSGRPRVVRDSADPLLGAAPHAVAQRLVDVELSAWLIR